MATDPRTIEAYNQNAEAYNNHVLNPDDSIYHAYYEKPAIRAELPELDGLSVISIGCGSGVDAQWLADNGAEKVVGIDVSERLIEIANKEHPKIEFQVMDMEKLEFPDASFDLAYSSLAIHYLSDWTTALTEARRVLKPGSKYVFSCGHPIDTALDYNTIGETKSRLLGRTINKDGESTAHGDYLAKDTNGVKPFEGVVGGFPVSLYHRTISEMVEEISKSGFTIKKLIEPQPTEELSIINPGIYDRLTRIPEFMVWVLENGAKND